MSLSRRALVSAAFALCTLVACGDSESPAGDDAAPKAERVTLNLTGSSTVAPLAMEIGKRFEKQQDNVRVDVQTGGSSRGLADARNGVVDLGMMSRGLKDEETDVVAHTIAVDGIAVIVHSDNTVVSLDDQQVIDIYTGKINDWSEVGGAAGPITVANKAEGRSTLEMFLKHYKLKNSEIQADVVVGDNEQGIKTVASNPGAVGYVSVGAAQASAEAGVTVRPLPSAGVDATMDNVANGTFPLSRPLILVSSGELNDTAKAFVAFAQDPAQHDLVGQLYFVPPKQ